ncbi:MAG: periplasmic heavy metal sensor [Novosphingobium sp.]
MRNLPRYLLVALIAFSAALAATWIARSMAASHAREGGELHGLMHEEMDLDADQKAKVKALEAQFAQRRQGLDARLQAANAQLAAAMASEHEYGPRVAEAVDASHMAMGDLQKATLAHVFAMRAVLRPDQAARFDAAVGKALTRPGQR